MEAGGGIEPPIEALQAPALPLCYPATYKMFMFLDKKSSSKIKVCFRLATGLDILNLPTHLYIC